MKKFIFALLLLVLLAFSVCSRAGTTNLLNLTYVQGTNNGSTFLASGIYIPPQRFIFQNLGLTNVLGGNWQTNGITNSITINIQVSVDSANSNWITLATYVPSGTNATVDNFNPTFNSVTLSMRAQIISSNSPGISTFVTQ